MRDAPEVRKCNAGFGADWVLAADEVRPQAHRRIKKNEKFMYHFWKGKLNDKRFFLSILSSDHIPNNNH